MRRESTEWYRRAEQYGEGGCQVFQWDDSLVVPLPETLVEKMGLKDGEVR
jgi:hypothetical protein